MKTDGAFQSEKIRQSQQLCPKSLRNAHKSGLPIKTGKRANKSRLDTVPTSLPVPTTEMVNTLEWALFFEKNIQLGRTLFVEAFYRIDNKRENGKMMKTCSKWMVILVGPKLTFCGMGWIILSEIYNFREWEFHGMLLMENCNKFIMIMVLECEIIIIDCWN